MAATQQTVGIVKQTFQDFMEDKVMRLAAALAYYSIFSIGPLLLLLVGIAGFFFGQGSAREQIHQQLQSIMSPQAAQMVESMMSARQTGGSLLATILGAAALILGATGVFAQLQDSLNTIWEVQAKPGRGVWGVIRDRLLSFLMILGIGILLLASMALSTILSALPDVVGQFVPIPPILMQVINIAISLALMTLLFAAVFKILPQVQIRWRSVWLGAFVTAVLFVLGQYLLSFYLGRQSTASAFGAAGSIVLVLLWVYYSSLILFFGAEFTKVYARRKGAGIQPSENAVPVTEEARAHQGMPPRERLEHPERIPAPQPSYASSQPERASVPRPRQEPSTYPAPAQKLAHTSESSHPIPIDSPGAVIKEHRWQFFGLALGMAVIARLVRKSRFNRDFRWVGKVRKLASYRA